MVELKKLFSSHFTLLHGFQYCLRAVLLCYLSVYTQKGQELEKTLFQYP